MTVELIFGLPTSISTGCSFMIFDDSDIVVMYLTYFTLVQCSAVNSAVIANKCGTFIGL